MFPDPLATGKQCVMLHLDLMKSQWLVYISNEPAGMAKS